MIPYQYSSGTQASPDAALAALQPPARISCNSWLIADGWRPGLSCDTMHQDRWHGTECAGGSIHRLELIANNIQGTLPTEIGAMPDLRMLAIESNPLLSGTVPTEIGAMHSLRTLSIHNNTRLSGTLPSQLAVLTKLRFLSALNVEGECILGQESSMTMGNFAIPDL